MHKYAAQMHALFRGNENAYGEFKLTGEEDERGKALGKPRTVKQILSDEEWSNHLNGNIGLGVVPIDEESKCRWGCIDVDEYPAREKEVLADIAKHKLPLYTCFSKSRGLHLFLFLSKPFPAKDVRACLQAMAGVLGFGDKEIFPKQTVRGIRDIGNWLNMPYFGNTRKCKTAKKELSLEEFLDFITPLDKLPKVEPAKSARFADGPPCLQTLAAKGGIELKHNFLLACSVYLRMKNPEGWQEELRILNSEPGLLTSPHSKIEELIRNLESNPAQGYSCNDQPICGSCNRPECSTKLYGVTQGECRPTELVCHVNGQTADTYAIVTVKGKQHSISVTTKELYTPQEFAMVIWDRLQIVMSTFPQKEWQKLIKSLPVTRIEMAETYEETLFDKLRQHCLAHNTYERNDLLVNEKLVYYDKAKNRAYFKARAMAESLKCRIPALDKIVVQNGGNNKLQYNVSGINRRYSWLPLDVILEVLPLPKMPEDEEEPI